MLAYLQRGALLDEQVEVIAEPLLGLLLLLELRLDLEEHLRG